MCNRKMKNFSDFFQILSTLQHFFKFKSVKLPSDCITYIENGEVRVIVQGNVLDAGSVSQIKDIVVSQTGILPKNIKISSQE